MSIVDTYKKQCKNQFIFIQKHSQASSHYLTRNNPIALYLAERGKQEGLANLTSIEGAPEDPNLPGAVDVMLMVDVYHHIADRVGYLRAVRKYLEPGGRLAIIDHVDTPGSALKDERSAPSRIKAELKRAGYELAAEHLFLPEQYFLIFKPAAR